MRYIIIVLALIGCVEAPQTYDQCDFTVTIRDRQTKAVLEKITVKDMYDWVASQEKFDTVVFYKTPYDMDNNEVAKSITRKGRGFWIEKIPDSCVEIRPSRHIPGD